MEGERQGAEEWAEDREGYWQRATKLACVKDLRARGLNPRLPEPSNDCRVSGLETRVQPMTAN